MRMRIKSNITKCTGRRGKFGVLSLPSEVIRDLHTVTAPGVQPIFGARYSPVHPFFQLSRILNGTFDNHHGFRGEVSAYSKGGPG